MNISYVAGRYRCTGVYLWLGYMSWVAWYWMGLVGVGLVCVASTHGLRKLWSNEARVVQLDAMNLSEIWIVPWALYIRTVDEHLWLCRDEIPTAQWAGLLRLLKLHGPRQAVGLSISN